MSEILVCGIDPGPQESAFVLWDGARIIEYGNAPNRELLVSLTYPVRSLRSAPPHVSAYAIERIRGYGMMASDSLFDTCEWIGRFLQAFGEERTTLIGRKEVSRHICNNSGISHDKFIREALIQRFGGLDAVGKKKTPGPLWGITGHLWAALAVALTYYDGIPESTIRDLAEAQKI